MKWSDWMLSEPRMKILCEIYTLLAECFTLIGSVV
jgi:hypothetical protein